MPRRLKVYEWTGHRREAGGTHQQTQEIVAATSMAEVARLAGAKGPWQLFNLSETGNDAQIATAMAAPGIIFWRDIHGYAQPWVRDGELPAPRAADHV